MGAQFDPEDLRVYQAGIGLVAWCDQLCKRACIKRPVAMSLDKASTGGVLNIAEGNGRFSSRDRCRFIDPARTAALQAAAILDLVSLRQGKTKPLVAAGKSVLADIVRMLVAWQASIERR